MGAKKELKDGTERDLDKYQNKKTDRLLTSHRYNRLPLLHSCPGGVQQELVVQDLPEQQR